MLRQYNGYGGFCRSLTRLDPSKQFGPHATMTLSAVLTPRYCPPPLSTILYGGTFFSEIPLPLYSQEAGHGPDHLAPLKTHGSKCSPLVSTSEFFGCGDILGIFPASNSKTLKPSLFFHPHSTDFHHFHLLKEDHDKPVGISQGCPSITSPASSWPPKGRRWERRFNSISNHTQDSHPRTREKEMA
jgi:hypothetical protein